MIDWLRDVQNGLRNGWVLQLRHVIGRVKVTPMTLAPTKTLLDHVEAEEEILLGLWNHFATLKAFEQELVKRIGTRKFVIANTVVWEAMIAKRDLVVIRFASWVRGIVEPGGFFRQVRAHHVNDLRKTWASQAPQGDELAFLQTSRRRSRLEALFPAAAARNQVDPDDVDALKDTTWDQFKAVVQDATHSARIRSTGRRRPTPRCSGSRRSSHSSFRLSS